jgi:D-glycero-D-manno-heptose 1,7-bisphosphate phosphatase
MTRKAAFLDRDGTIISNAGALTADKSIEPLPEAVDAIRKLRAAGFFIVMITNQSAVARGYYTEEELAVAHQALLQKLEDDDAPIDAVYYCPHHPDTGEVSSYVQDCDCRKPKPGMLLQAAEQHNIDLAASYMVGDAERDVEAGVAAGCRATVLIIPDVLNSFSIVVGPAPVWEQIMENMEEASKSAADAVVPDISVAADFILEMENEADG